MSLVENRQMLLERAELCGEWMLRNQVTSRFDANRGRGIDLYDLQTDWLYRTANWTTGILCCCMCAMYKRTGDERYLVAAEYAGRYIMSLQVMDPSEKKYYGLIREITPQTLEIAPRDATSGAWGLVWLYNTLGERIYLDRAVKFAEWHMEYGMHDGWPLYALTMDDKLEDFYSKGGFQSGTGLFYHDLFRATGDSRFIERGFKPIAEQYRDCFIRENGRIIQKLNAFTNKEFTHGIQGMEPDVDMHEYNDDFGGAMLQMAADFFEDESFREAALRYAKWLASVQDEDGRYAGGKVPSGIPTSLMYFHDLGTYYNDQELLDAREKTLSAMLDMQNIDTGYSMLDGGFTGLRRMLKGDEPVVNEKSGWVNMRSTSYSLMALLKLECNLEDVWLGRFNGKWIDPLDRGVRHNFKW